MQHIYGLQDANVSGVWLSIGSFDGVHLGHQSIINKLTAGAHAAGAPAVVLTFYPHPSVVLRGPRESFYLTTPEEKAELLGELGVDLVITHPFNQEVAQMSAEDFIGQLVKHLTLAQLWVGYDFSLGRDREGNLPKLKEIGEKPEYNFSVHEVSALLSGGAVVSSSRIRSLLEAGDIESPASLLGRSFSISGEVVKGEGRGRKLGIPTANLSIAKERVVPGAGVYAGFVTHQGKSYPAVTNIGVRPTFEDLPVAPRAESHILDFNEDLYGEEINLSFIARLRSEMRFESVEALMAQINLDIEKAREVLKDIN
ncbi:MAG: bifunctional riboflavin kinase/FAD synthetase [Chloroflexota bacterium]